MTPRECSAMNTKFLSDLRQVNNSSDPNDSIFASTASIELVLVQQRVVALLVLHTGDGRQTVRHRTNVCVPVPTEPPTLLRLP